MRKYEPDHDGKWAKFHPLWDGFYTILFTPPETTKLGSHIRDGVDLKRTMMMVIVALVPCLLFGIYNTGHFHYVATGETIAFMDMFWDKVVYGLIKVLPLVVVSYGVGLGVEFIFCIKNQHPIQEGFLVSGMLIPLIVPADVPLWMLAVAVIFAVVIGKEVFGGTGMNIVNVALTARAFLFFGYPTKMSGNDVWYSGISDVVTRPDGVTGATALGDMATTVSLSGENRIADENISALKEKMTELPELVGQFTSQAEALEKGISENAIVIQESLDKIPSLMDSMIGMIPGSVGETSVFAIGIGALVLLGTGIGSWRIMLSFLVGGLAMGYLLNATAVNPFMELDPIHQIALGGFAFGAVFMITDPVTAAQTNTGKWIYGFLAGFFAIMIRVLNPAFPEGVMMAILFFNILAPLIDHYVVQANIKRRMKRLKTKTA